MAYAFLLSKAQIELSSYRKYYQKRGAEKDRGQRKKASKGKIVMISFQQMLRVRGRVEPITLFINSGRDRQTQTERESMGLSGCL